jgi:hypothetical protein
MNILLVGSSPTVNDDLFKISSLGITYDVVICLNNAVQVDIKNFVKVKAYKIFIQDRFFFTKVNERYGESAEQFWEKSLSLVSQEGATVVTPGKWETEAINRLPARLDWEEARFGNSRPYFLELIRRHNLGYPIEFLKYIFFPGANVTVNAILYAILMRPKRIDIVGTAWTAWKQYELSEGLVTLRREYANGVVLSLPEFRDKVSGRTRSPSEIFSNLSLNFTYYQVLAFSAHYNKIFFSNYSTHSFLIPALL